MIYESSGIKIAFLHLKGNEEMGLVNTPEKAVQGTLHAREHRETLTFSIRAIFEN